MNEDLKVEWAGWRRYYHGKPLAFTGGGDGVMAVVCDDEGRVHVVDPARLCVEGSAAALSNHEAFVADEACRAKHDAYNSAYDGVADTAGVPI